MLVTRPEGLGEALAARLAAAGAGAECVPLLKIVPVDADAIARDTAMSLDRFDIVIVTSRHAVQFGMPLLSGFWPQWPAAQQWLAVGAATASALAAWRVSADAPADPRSEGLLALPALTDVAGRRVLLLTGEGGRGLIEASLAARGAQVTRLAVYRRDPCTSAATALPAFRGRQGARAVLLTSVEALHNLLALAPWLPASDVQVIAGGERIAAASRAAGVALVVDAGGADDEHMVAALTRLAAQPTR